jgi:hypothetical protein
VLHVRQRPSYGTAGPRQELRLTDTAHNFLRDKQPAPLEQTALQHTVTCLHARMAVAVEPLSIHNAQRRSHQERQAARCKPVRLLLLLVRVTHGPLGPIPVNLADAPDVTLHVSTGLVGPVITAGTHIVPVAEWRLDSEIEPVPQLPWEAFPAAAERIADWIAEQAYSYPDHAVLLAARIPQELAVGLGIQLGQRANAWPRHMYPVFYAHQRLVVPQLLLGAESVPTERA